MNYVLVDRFPTGFLDVTAPESQKTKVDDDKEEVFWQICLRLRKTKMNHIK